MANIKGGDFKKFTVIKNEDLNNLPQSEIFKESLRNICDCIKMDREAKGKSTDNKYLVINIDEPYADKIIEILKTNGHWG